MSRDFNIDGPGRLYLAVGGDKHSTFGAVVGVVGLVTLNAVRQPVMLDVTQL